MKLFENGKIKLIKQKATFNSFPIFEVWELCCGKFGDLGWVYQCKVVGKTYADAYKELINN